MKIFYVAIDEFKKLYGRDFLKPFADIELKSEKRFYEYTIGRYLVCQAAKEFYNIKNTEIVFSPNGKPQFKNADLNFSISHSKNIVMVCFDNLPCGIDIEYIKPRDFEKLAKHYNQNFKNAEDFYKFWTLKEASFKLGCSVKDYRSFEFKNDYFVTVTTTDELKKDIPAVNYLAR